MKTDAGVPIQELVLSTSKIVKRPGEGSYYAYGCGEGQYLELFKYDGDSVSMTDIVLDTPPHFKDANGSTYNMIDRQNRGIRIRRSADAVFVFYEHPTDVSDHKGFPGYYGDRLDVFGWDGRREDPLYRFYG